jgi:hypothetical protein
MPQHSRAIGVALVCAAALATISPAAACARPADDVTSLHQPLRVSPPHVVGGPTYEGFDWADAAVGAAGGVASSLAAVGSGLVIVRRRSRRYAAAR